MSNGRSSQRISAKAEIERIIYRIGGLPVAAAALFGGWDDVPDPLRAAYAEFYWHPGSLREMFELGAAGLLWPVALIGTAVWFTWRNGAIIRQRFGKPIRRQLLEQLRFFWTSGMLPPWYYAFELFDRRSPPRAFLSRFETKQGYYRVLLRHRGSQSPLGDKLAFAQCCRDHQVATVPVFAVVQDGEITWLEGDRLPERDLFFKPVKGRGGTGAERWDYSGEGRYRGSNGDELSGEELLNRLTGLSHDRATMVQPRLTNCDELSDVNNGALSTVRILTCLDEQDRPEVVGAVLRMAIGENHRVDNFHAGGIAASIDLESGELSSASNMGMDAKLGWLDRHPNTDAPIRGRSMPHWRQVRELAESAHRAFDDRVIIGWDIAVTADGPVVVEGNARPDLDIMQRPSRTGLAGARFGELLLHHMRRGTAVAATPLQSV